MICENCGKEHDGSYGSGRFCSKECARSFSSKNTTGQLKEAKCINCGKTIYIGKRASLKTCRCNECNNLHNQLICKICGQKYNKNEGGCKNNFCKNTSLQFIKSLIKYFGFDQNKLGTLEVENEFLRIKEFIKNLYINDRITENALKEKFNYTSGLCNFHKILKQLNIKTLSSKEATKLAYLLGRSGNEIVQNQYKCNWHTTWNNKEVYLRSSFELDYAKELDEQQIDYDVECLRIKYWDSQKQEFRCAIPDFYLPKQNLIIEIKSSWTLDKQNMIDKVKAYKDLGYNFKLICDYKEMPL